MINDIDAKMKGKMMGTHAGDQRDRDEFTPEPVSSLSVSRISRFWCWVKYGHCWDKTSTSRMMSREMNRCIICGAYEPGPG